MSKPSTPKASTSQGKKVIKINIDSLSIFAFSGLVVALIFGLWAVNDLNDRDSKEETVLSAGDVVTDLGSDSEAVQGEDYEEKKEYKATEYSDYYRDTADEVVKNFVFHEEEIKSREILVRIDKDNTDLTRELVLKNNRKLKFECEFPEDKSFPPIFDHCDVFIDSEFIYEAAGRLNMDLSVEMGIFIFEDERFDFTFLILSDWFTGSKDSIDVYLVYSDRVVYIPFNERDFDENFDGRFLGSQNYKLHIDESNNLVFVSGFHDIWYGCDCMMYSIFDVNLRKNRLDLRKKVWESKDVT